MDRWALIVIRANGADVEILSHLFKSAAEAHEYGAWNASKWKGVTLEVVKVTVPLNGEKVVVQK